jgi:uncharacterized membrane protein YedE/YeeE
VSTLLYGSVAGVLFGFFLQKARVIRYDKQLGALRFIDMTIVKFMLSSIIVSMVGVHILLDLGWITLSVKPTILGGNIVGGLIFGAGWGLLGYCPGTAMGALGEGRWDGLVGILGMLVGAALFAEAYPGLRETLLTWGDFGQLTFPTMLGVSHWFIIPLYVIAATAFFLWLEKKGL